MRIENILVPVDFSEFSGAAVKQAIDFAKAFDAEVHLLHCYQLNPGGVVPYGPAFPPAIYEQMQEAAAVQLRKVHAEVESAGVAAKMHLSSDVPSHAIEEAARSLDADLIVMGTHGHTGLKHVLLGSVAERTLRHAPCPVLTVGSARPN